MTLMLTGKRGALLTPDEAAEARETMARTMAGELNPRFGKPGTMSGRNHSENSKLKMGDANRGRTLTVEHRRKVSESLCGRTISDKGRANMAKAKMGENNPNFGRVYSLEERARMSATRTGEKRTPETCANIAAARRGKKHSDETRAKLSELGKNPEVLLFESVATGERIRLTRYEAGKQLGVSRAVISYALAGPNRTGKGFRIMREQEAA